MAIVPWFLSALLGILAGLIAWGVWRALKRETRDLQADTQDDVFLGLLLFAAFGLGVFVAYLVLGFGT